ncbi:LysM peptidoglycan-binding domain-containing protein [Apilactobacillus kunkeei]|nr:LysM peptidoglycan-binding domain-containing protein [Apilactobacillus kunkeei]
MKSMLFATAAVAGLFVAGGASANADQTANASVQQPQQQAKATVKKTVTVQSGDTLWGLSQKYNVSLSSLRAVNNRVNTDLIYVGEKLTLPSSATVMARSISNVETFIFNPFFIAGIVFSGYRDFPPRCACLSKDCEV